MATTKKKKHYSRFLIFLNIVLGLIAVSIIVYRLTPVKNYFDNRSRATTTTYLSFPRDHASHPSYAAEWWYINLRLNTTKEDGTDQREYASLVSFSRINNNSGLLTSLADLKSNTFSERTLTQGSLNVSINTAGRLGVRYVNDNLRMMLNESAPLANGAKKYSLQGTMTNGGSLLLTLTERTVPRSGTTTPLLWGCTGKISVFGTNDTYYYSIPDLDTTGSIQLPDGTRRIVTGGKAWIDHQWFNNVPPYDWEGHYWMSGHWSRSQNIYDRTSQHQALGYVTQVYDNGEKYTYWVRRKTDGTNACGNYATAAFSSYSPTGYPNIWNVSLKNSPTSIVASFTATATSDNQVFNPPIGPDFFEPAAKLTGTIDGAQWYGIGFLETHLKRQTILQTQPIDSSGEITQ